MSATQRTTAADAGMAGDLAVGDRIEQRNGPFVATWKVVEIVDAGARLAYCGDVRFVGYRERIVNAYQEPLTEDSNHSFLGRAHWTSAKRMPAPPVRAQPQRTAEQDRERRTLPCVGGGMHAYRKHGNPNTDAAFSACIACGVTESDADYQASGRGN